MATDTALDHHSDVQDGNLWEGAKEPFKASYGKLMMWYFLLSDAFTFAGFLISYGALRFSVPTWPVPDFVFKTAPFGVDEAPLIFVTIMTFVLIVSSVTMVRAVQEGHRENKGGAAFWLLLTIVGGASFLGCQAWEWNNLIGTEGMTVTINPFSSHTEAGVYLSGEELEKAGLQKVEADAHGTTATYYLQPGKQDIPQNRFFVKADHHGHSLAGTEFAIGGHYLITKNHDTHLYEFGAYKSEEDGQIRTEKFGPKAFGALFFFITGFHGFHVFSGVMFLTIIAVNVASGLYVKRRNGYEMVEKMGLYWHFVDLVWVFVFLVFYLL
ncbi:MAG: cytochrome c oxidase subunit 3 [Saprospirales bacterium]|nr:cytochrome c oxidase subunit 3 [Saprospirales bacterium]MBK6901944.1 cytochrome c oxidase subunit 3 [Saprospirales bacterium]